MTKDPFSMVYSKLWDMAETCSLLTDAVKLGNRIRYDQERDPSKRHNLDADMPQLSLVSDGLTASMYATSSSSQLIWRYSWLIWTGDLRITLRALPVQWALFVAMHGWQTELTSLRWKQKSFVKKLSFLEITNGIFNPETDVPKQVPRGWAAIWGIDVLMNFSIQDIESVRTE